MDTYYYTSDIALTAYLKTKGNEVVKVFKDDDKKVKFTFKNTSDIQGDVLAYYNNDEKSTVKPKQFFEEISAVKAMLYNAV